MLKEIVNKDKAKSSLYSRAGPSGSVRQVQKINYEGHGVGFIVHPSSGSFRIVDIAFSLHLSSLRNWNITLYTRAQPGLY